MTIKLFILVFGFLAMLTFMVIGMLTCWFIFTRDK